MPLCSPIYDPAHAITGRATGAAVTGCRFATCAATKVDGGNVPIKHCGATDEPIGVIANDTAQDATVAVYKNGFVVPVLVGGTGVTFGEVCEVLAGGSVQDFSAGKRCGISLTTTAAAGFALVLVQV